MDLDFNVPFLNPPSTALRAMVLMVYRTNSYNSWWTHQKPARNGMERTPEARSLKDGKTFWN